MKRTEITNEFALMLKIEYEHGYSANYLGKKYGLSGDVVSIILRSIGVNFNSIRTKKGFNLILTDKDNFIEDYSNPLISINEISHKYKVCEGTVRKYAKSFNIRRENSKTIFAEKIEEILGVLSRMGKGSREIFWSNFTEKQKRAMELRYNISNEGFLTLQEIGFKLNITKERVRQIIVKAERKALHLISFRKIVEINGEYIFKTNTKHNAKHESIDYGNTDDIVNARIEVLDLSVRAYNALGGTGMVNVKDLNEHDLLKVRNFGRKCLDELKSKFKEYELKLPTHKDGAIV